MSALWRQAISNRTEILQRSWADAVTPAQLYVNYPCPTKSKGIWSTWITVSPIPALASANGQLPG
jgi:hypothetical protein